MPRMYLDAVKPFKISLSLLFVATSSLVLVQQQNNVAGTSMKIPVKVGVVLDLSTRLGQMGLSCINMSLSDFYAAHPSSKTRLVLEVRDSMTGGMAAVSAALDLIKNQQVQAIIGPQYSMQVESIIELGDKAHVPFISFSATSPSLEWIRSPYFIRAAQSDSFQTNVISSLMQEFRWREAIFIYENNSFGEGLIASLTNALQKANVLLPKKTAISPLATDEDIHEELKRLMTTQTRVFIVHMLSRLGSRLFIGAKKVGMMNEGYAWIMTNGITDLLSSMDPSIITSSMQGVLGVRAYVPNTVHLSNFTVRWKKKFQQDHPSIINPQLNNFGYWAYDAAWALAIAFEEIGSIKFSFQNAKASTHATDIDTIGISQNGQKLLQALANTRFTGLAGNFNLLDGQLESLAFQIVNINEDHARGVGFWTPKDGIMKYLNSTNKMTYPFSKSKLGSIIWPGDSTSIPKGMRLRILVPVKEGFREFVKVTHQDLSTNATQVTGYCIEIFQEVIENLPYALAYDLIPFALRNGSSVSSYNDMIDQVLDQRYHAMVGDTTIIANRSLYVDFTLPYTESGVLMVVPYKNNKSKNAWIFLKPLTWDLWLTTGGFFVFMAIVVWTLEHRVNEDFRGPAAHQVGISFWFSFSTLVFAQREKVSSNLARFVVIIWFFVVLILTQSYTASLSSLLVIQNLQPTVKDVDQLLKSGENVGYQYGSFVHEMLKQLKFPNSRLNTYKSLEELDALLSKGSAKGGISAAFDEVPYIKLFLSKYCNKYSTIPTLKTAGFGFVFPKGSPLVPDISQVILNITEGPKMAKIENTWFPKETNCLDSASSDISNSLSLDSFWGLFLIAGVVAIMALIIFMSIFLKNNWHVVTSSTGSLWEKVACLGRQFNQRDLSFHTFRKGKFQDDNGVNHCHEIQVVEASSPPIL